ncbi:MAG: hypothetical protein L0154_03720 [Chloroflexi bacterium]|nr:hypothetical protein [Chloroflexota bacterium]
MTSEALFPQNFVPFPYRQVSVQPYYAAMTPETITAHLLGKDSYRRTRFVILEQPEACAVAVVEREDEKSLFSPITAVSILALPETCWRVEDKTVDTGNPSALAAKARELRLDSSATLVVHGLDGHVNFIHRPAPLKIEVIDVIPPEPPKLYRMAQQVVAYVDLPAVELQPRNIDLRDLAQQSPDASAYLIPCRASGLEFDVPTYFLDERPEKQDWVMIACERSRQIHRHFYQAEAPCIELCPRRQAHDGNLQLVKCCLLEDQLEIDGNRVIVPWGASLLQIESGLRKLIELHEQ